MLGGAIIGTQLTQFNGLQFFGNLLAVLPELSNALGNDFVKEPSFTEKPGTGQSARFQ